MSLDHILLGLLREPATGYDLKNVFSETVRHFWSARLSQIYPTLERLEQQEMLRSRREPSPKGPDRKVYAVTEKGRAELLTWLRSEPAVGTERFAYLAQLYFMDAVGDIHETQAFMSQLRDHFSGWLDQLRAVERDIVDTYGDPEGYEDAGFHHFAALRMGIHSLAAKVAWCEETLVAIDRRIAGHQPAGPGTAVGARPDPEEDIAS